MVALFTRAWIEIGRAYRRKQSNFGSPSSRGRGLKYHLTNVTKTSEWSPSSRGRGLKSCVIITPALTAWSPSSRGRGLKYEKRTILNQLRSVALFTRAWIEIIQKNTLQTAVTVALFTRAWIEIAQLLPDCILDRSPSSRGRGLKSKIIAFITSMR